MSLKSPNYLIFIFQNLYVNCQQKNTHEGHEGCGVLDVFSNQ